MPPSSIPPPNDNDQQDRSKPRSTNGSVGDYNPLDNSSSSNAQHNPHPHTDETNPFVTFRRFADAQFNAVFNALNDLPNTIAELREKFEDSFPPSSNTSAESREQSGSTSPSTTSSTPSPQTTTTTSDATRNVFRRLGESYDRSMDPNRVGAARERQHDKDKEDGRKREDIVIELWTPPLPDRDMLGFGWWSSPLFDRLRENRDKQHQDKGSVFDPLSLSPWRGAPWDQHSPGPWRPSVQWMTRDRYSPLVLEQQPRLQARGRKWRQAFEDLLLTEGMEEEVADVGSEKEMHSNNNERRSREQPSTLSTEMAEPAHNWLRRLVHQRLVHPGHARDHERGPWEGVFGHLSPYHRHWGWDGQCPVTRRIWINGVLQGEEESERHRASPHGVEGEQAEAHVRETAAEDSELEQGIVADSLRTPQTELDMYEHFLEQDSSTTTTAKYKWPVSPPSLDPPSPQHEPTIEPTQSQTQTQAKPELIGTSTTTERRMLPDGTVTTKTILRRRYSDGSEERDENVNTTHIPVHSYGSQRTSDRAVDDRDIGRRDDNGHADGSSGDKGKKERKNWFWSGS